MPYKNPEDRKKADQKRRRTPAYRAANLERCRRRRADPAYRAKERVENRERMRRYAEQSAALRRRGYAVRVA